MHPLPPGTRRILVVGCSGSGKSTLSRSLHRSMGLPLQHLDQHYFSPGWREPDRDTWEATVESLVEEPS